MRGTREKEVEGKETVEVGRGRITKPSDRKANHF